MDSALHPGKPLHNASNAQLEQATAENHRQLFGCNAIALGGYVHTADGLTYMHTPSCGSTIAFPRLPADATGEQLDVMMDYFRSQEADNIGCWSLAPSTPPDLETRLLARGFQLGWQPCWMALALQGPLQEAPMPAGLEIKASNDIPIRQVAGLPYGSDGAAISEALLKTFPNSVQRFIAFLHGAIVGQTVLFFSSGPLAIAGMYNVGVLPAFQRRGIGKALVTAACQFAQAKGYSYTMLNANQIGRPLYEKVGFRFIGYGCTWWIVGKNYITAPPDAATIAWAEAVGRGDLNALAAKEGTWQKELSEEPLTNGMTLLQLAVHSRQPASAEWLINKGAACTALDAWDLGWTGMATTMLKTDPQEASRKYFSYQGNLLHIAAMRGDTELAKLALQAGADLNLPDIEYHATPVGWAHHFHRSELLTLFRNHTPPVQPPSGA